MILMTAFIRTMEEKSMENNLWVHRFYSYDDGTSNYGVECKVGLTGFKWIAKMIKDFPELEFIGGGEESFGFMVGDAVRDKDAVAPLY
jgi:phosphomannomutase